MQNYVSTKDALTATAKTLIPEREKLRLEAIAQRAPVRISEAFIQRVALQYMLDRIEKEGYAVLFQH